MFNYILMAVLVQQVAKKTYDIVTKKKNRWIKIVSIIVSVIIVFNTNMNMISVVFGISEKYPVVGKLITALLLSDGPSFLQWLYEMYLADQSFK